MYTEENNQGIYVEKQVRVPSFSMSYEHIHTYCEFFYLKKGNCIYSVNKNLYHLSAGGRIYCDSGGFPLYTVRRSCSL